jgi:competence protein ComEC
MARYPSLRLFINLVAGMALGLILPAYGSVFIASGLLLIGLMILFLLRSSESGLKAAYVLFVIVAGAALSSNNILQIEKNNIATFANRTAWLKASILDHPFQNNTNTKCVLTVSKLFDKGDTIDVQGKVLVNIHGKPGEIPVLHKGDKVWVYGRLLLPVKASSPNEFDYRAYLANSQIYATLSVYGPESVEKTGHEFSWFQDLVIGPMRVYLLKAIDTLFEHAQAQAFLKATVLGERHYLSPETKLAFQTTGTFHLLAISGLHVGLIFFVVTNLFQRLKRTAAGKLSAAILASAMLLFYAQLTGNAPPVERATLMGIVFLWAPVLQRNPEPLNSLFFADVIILFQNPNDLLGPSFLLSNAAVLSIILLYPKLTATGLKENFIKHLSMLSSTVSLMIWKLYTLIALSFSATIGVWPLLGLYFEHVPLLGMAVNVPVTILTVIAFYAVIPALAFFGLSIGLSSLYAAFVESILITALYLTRSASGWEMAAIPFKIGLPELFFILAIALTLLHVSKPGLWPKYLIASLISLNVWIWPDQAQNNPRFFVHNLYNELIAGVVHDEHLTGFQLSSSEPKKALWLKTAIRENVSEVFVSDAFGRRTSPLQTRKATPAVLKRINKDISKLILPGQNILICKKLDELNQKLLWDINVMVFFISEWDEQMQVKLERVLASDPKREALFYVSPKLKFNERTRLAKWVFGSQQTRLLNRDRYFQRPI